MKKWKQIDKIAKRVLYIGLILLGAMILYNYLGVVEGLYFNAGLSAGSVCIGYFLGEAESK